MQGHSYRLHLSLAFLQLRRLCVGVLVLVPVYLETDTNGYIREPDICPQRRNLVRLIPSPHRNAPGVIIRAVHRREQASRRIPWSVRVCKFKDWLLFPRPCHHRAMQEYEGLQEQEALEGPACEQRVHIDKSFVRSILTGFWLYRYARQ
jgi:hypothetical protein